jgi:diguanylate cyclase (GGDEF)-like protein/PAS domain S-box-containing protein
MDRMPHHLAREHLLAAILESTEHGVLGVALDGTIATWSQGAECLYGYTAQEIVGQPLNRLVPLYEQQALQLLLSQPDNADFRCCEDTERLHQDGSRLLLRIQRTLVRDPRGQIEGILESARAHNASGGTSADQAMDQRLIEQMPLFLWTTDQNLRITSNWGKGKAFSRIRPGALVGRSVCDFLQCADRHATPHVEHYAALRGMSARFEYRRENRVVEIRVDPFRNASGETIGCLGLAVDITNRKKNEEELLFQARHDALTGLANYREFIDILEREVRRAERSHHSFTLLLLDLDELKKINDLQGHLAGNRALKRLAAVMNEHCRSTDLAARYGGDEFAVILIDSDLGMAEQVAHRIENRLRNDEEKPALTVSLGISVYPEDGRTAAELIEAADRQLYQRKKAPHGRGATAI